MAPAQFSFVLLVGFKISPMKHLVFAARSFITSTSRKGGLVTFQVPSALLCARGRVLLLAGLLPAPLQGQVLRARAGRRVAGARPRLRRGRALPFAGLQRDVRIADGILGWK